VRINMQTRRLRPRGDENGFTMIITLGVLFVSSLLMTAAFVAAEGDINLTHNDTSAKKAYYAAQAGISDYAFHLNADFNYWTYCTGGAAASNKALNQVGSTANKVAVPGSSEEEYAIQLLPASTAPVADKKCDPASPVSTMIQSTGANGGTFRIESTGYSGKEKRTLLATFAHTSFLNFLYYTQYETLDPATYEPSRPECEAFHAEREEKKLPCSNIQFINADVVNGPMHTEDEASICSTPTFGRGPEDRIEFKRGSTSGGGGCSNSAIYKGTLIPPEEVPQIEPPPSNVSLKATAQTKYTGKTIIVLEGEAMTVTNNKKTEKVAFPKNGVVYVSNNTCSKAYTPYNPSYSADTECGNVYVSGNYTSSLTIGAENDIIINGNLKPPVEAKGEPTTNAVLGLVANNFVRVYHPVGQTYKAEGAKEETCKENGQKEKEKYLGEHKCAYTNNATECDAPNLSAAEDLPEKWGTMPKPEIYAAILAVNHSFIVDNFKCGVPLEKLTIYGAIAQIFRGTVGTHNGEAVASGYSKNYNYDERLEVESPPYFLNPITASWAPKREVLAPNP
jgi:hypothetical protein